MKKFLQSLMLVAAMMLPWALQAQNPCTISVAAGQPYMENFDSYSGTTYSTAGPLPSCWAGYSNGTDATYDPHIVGSGTYWYTHSGSNCLIMTSGSESYGSEKYVVLPEFSMPLNQLQLSFWMCTESSTNGTLTVGYLTDTTTATFTPIQAIPASSATYHSGTGLQATAGVEYEVVLSQLPATATRLAFKWVYNTSYFSCCIDDVVVGTIPTCPKPANLTLSNITSSSADVHWTEMGTASSWVVEYGTGYFTPGAGDGTVMYANDTAVSLSNLQPNTIYRVAVHADCGSGDTSTNIICTFRTGCGGLTSVPFVEDFENQATTSSTSTTFIPCWGHLNNGTSYYGYPYLSSSSTYNHTPGGSKGLYWYNSITTGTYGDYQCIVLPGIDATELTISNLEVKFWAKASSASYHPVFQIGVMTDPTDITTFETLGNVSVEGTNWQEFEVPLSTYTGTGVYAAIKATRPSSAWYAYVDDISLEAIPTCPRTSEITTGLVSTTSIDLYWTENGSASSWVIEYDTVNFVPGTGNANSVTAYDTTYSLTGLDSAHTYYIYLHADCGSGDTSLNRFIMASTLAASPATLPYSCNFEEYGPNGWDFVDAGQANTWHVGSAANHGGTQSLYISDNNGTSNSYSGSTAWSFATRTFDFASAGEYAYSYDWLCNGESTFDYLRVALLPASTTLTAGSGCGFGNSTTYPAGAIPLDGGTKLNLSSSWSNQAGTFTITTPGAYMMVFAWHNDASTYNVPAATIDNVFITQNTCPGVQNLIANPGADEVTLTWQAVGSESEWVISDGTNEYTSYDTTYTITNLSANTSYTFYVRAVCGSDDTSMVSTVSARTACGLITALPWFDGFEGLTPGAAAETTYGVPCWARLDNASTYHFAYPGSISSFSSGAHTGTGFLYYYMPTTATTYADWIYTIMPEVDSSLYSINQLMVRFYAKMNSTTTAGDIVVGVMTNIGDATTFTAVDTVHVAGTDWTECEAMLGSYTGNHGRIALLMTRQTVTTYYFVDDVTMQLIPDCPHVSNLHASIVTGTDATIHWSENGTATSWEVEYGLQGFTRGNGTITNVYEDSLAISGLSPMTTYDVYVTPDCGSGIPESMLFSFTTACGGITTLPYIEDFESYGSGTTVFPSCWNKIGTTADRPYIHATTSYGHNNTHGLYFYAAASGYCYAVMPLVNHSIDSLQVSLWARQYSTSYNCAFAVGVMTNPNDITTFVAVDTVHPATTTYEQFEVPLSRYTGSGRYIAFRAIITSGSGLYLMLDDVTLDYMPDCPAVSNIHAAGLDSNMITVAWTENGSATSWDIEYGPHGFTPGNGVTDVAYSIPYVINGLTSNTDYDIYVAPSCTGVASPRMVTLRTANIYVNLPFVCNFEDAAQNSLWVLENGSNTNKWCIGTATNNGGTHSMYVSNTNGSTNAYDISSSSIDFAYVDVMVPAPGDYSIAYDWKAYGESSIDWIRVALVPASETLTAATSLPSGLSSTAMPAGWISLDGNTYLNQHTDWQTFIRDITLPSAGVYHLTFVWRNDGSVGTTPPGAIDNVALAQLVCPKPQNITSRNLTTTSSDFAWEEVGSATEWEYQLDNGTITTVYDTTCSLTGLTTNTAYTFRVRAICGAGDTSFWATYSFRTPCGFISLPYTEDFESQNTTSSSSNAFIPCWGHLNNGTSYPGYPYVSSSSTYNHTAGGSKGLYWYASTTTGTYGDYHCVVLPPVDSTTPANTLQLSFWAKASSTSYTPVFKIGVMTDPNNINSFVGVDTITIPGTTTWTNYEVSLDAYTGNGQYVAVKADRPTSLWYAYVDDFTLDVIPTCPKVTNVHATAAGSSDITVDWTDHASNTEWQVAYGPTTSNTPDPTTISIVYAHPATISGLDAMATYNVYVRPICGVGDTGRWSEAAAMSTAMCDNATIAYNFDATQTSTTTSYGPAHAYYKYSFSQTIIDSAYLATLNGGDINAIAFKPTVTTAGNYYNNCQVFLTPTTQSTFASATSFVNMDTSTTSTLVYSGDLNYSVANDWRNVGFSTPYTWDGHSNLIVTVVRNHGSYLSGCSFAAVSGTGTKMIYGYSDSYNVTPSSLTSWSGSTGSSSTYPQYQLLSCGAASCTKPGNLHTTNVDYNAATIAWAGNGTDYDVAIRPAASTSWPSETAVTGNTYTFTNLQPSTQYTARVRQNCGTELGTSDWVMVTFITDSLPCFAPENVEIVDVTNATVTVNWTANDNQSSWIVRVYSTTFDSSYAVNSHPATVGGFSAGTYNVTVSGMCGGVLQSDWSDTIQFTTVNCDPVSNVTATVNGNSATIAWTNGANNAGAWQLIYGEEGEVSTDDTPVNVTTNPYTISNLANGDYEVYVQAVCGTGWFSGWSENAHATFTIEGQGIADINSNLHVDIYPNPTSNATTISLSGVNGEVTIAVVDMNGRTIQTDRMECSGDCTKKLEVSGLAQGAYFVRIYGESVNTVKKLIVK